MYRFEFLLSITIILATAVLGTGTQNQSDRVVRPYPNFDLEVVVNGRPLTEYYARGARTLKRSRVLSTSCACETIQEIVSL